MLKEEWHYISQSDFWRELKKKIEERINEYDQYVLNLSFTDKDDLLKALAGKYSKEGLEDFYKIVDELKEEATREGGE